MAVVLPEVDGAASHGNSGERDGQNKPTLPSAIGFFSGPANIQQLPLQQLGTTTSTTPTSRVPSASVSPPDASSADDVGSGNVEAFVVARISCDGPDDYPHYDSDAFDFNDG